MNDNNNKNTTAQKPNKTSTTIEELATQLAILQTELETTKSELQTVKSRVNRNNNTVSNSLFRSDHVTHLETNLDDISGENLAFAIQMLLDNRALDAWVTPIVMKKGRPAYTLHCLCKDGVIDDEDNVNTLLELIFTHTLTLGVRIYRNVPRAKLDRFITTVETSYTNTSRKGLVDVKVSRFNNGKVVRKKAEFDHCKVISSEVRGVGISTVAEQAVTAYDKANTAQSTTFK